jgi:hypothetical protein
VAYPVYGRRLNKSGGGVHVWRCSKPVRFFLCSERVVFCGNEGRVRYFSSGKTISSQNSIRSLHASAEKSSRSPVALRRKL